MTSAATAPAQGSSSNKEASGRWIYLQPNQPQFIHHKTLPIKRPDSEPLTREDIQYDLLGYIFSDTNAVFTDQTPPRPADGPGPRPKVTFCELYVNALMNSSKCTKAQRDKMVETPSYAVDFAKLCLLVNTGRINTTLAFYPEMRTVLRTYHPVPSLQKTETGKKNMQDAPRMKSILKSCLLPEEERSSPPTTPSDILVRLSNNQVPSTSVVNLLFVLSNHAAPLSRNHFEPPMDFLDLFLPINIPSQARSRVFLWLVYHYLESPTGANPFDDAYSTKNPGKVPWMPKLGPDEMELENVDTDEEKEWGRKQQAFRITFLKQQINEEDGSFKTKEPAAKRARGSNANSGAGKAAQRLKTRPTSPTSDVVATPPLEPSREREFVPRQSRRYTPPRSRYTSRYEPNEPPPPRIEKTMLQHTLHLILSSDPLASSDDEADDEATMKADLELRCNVLSAITGDVVMPPPMEV